MLDLSEKQHPRHCRLCSQSLRAASFAGMPLAIMVPLFGLWSRSVAACGTGVATRDRWIGGTDSPIPSPAKADVRLSRSASERCRWRCVQLGHSAVYPSPSSIHVSGRGGSGADQQYSRTEFAHPHGRWRKISFEPQPQTVKSPPPACSRLPEPASDSNVTS